MSTPPSWTAVLALLTLACVTPPAPAGASQPTARQPACDGGPCGEPQPPAVQATPAPAAPVTAPPAPTPATAQPAPATPPAQPPAAPRPAPADPPCDSEWGDGQLHVIQIGERKDDGRPLRPFNPSDPLYPYELAGGRYLLGERGKVLEVIGRFEDRKQGEEALRQVETERPSARPFLGRLGPYLLPESPTCKVSRVTRMNNLVFDQASWLMEKEGVLLAGVQSPCRNGRLTKKVSVLSCDGTKTLFTDTSEHVCERNEHVATCVYSLEPGVVLLEHAYSLNGETTRRVRVHDVRKKKRLFHLESFSGLAPPGVDPDTQPRTTVEDVDQDGIPELVTTVPKTGQRASLRKWRQGRFIEVKSP